MKILSQIYLQWHLRNNFLLDFRYDFWELMATIENATPAFETLSLISQLKRSIPGRTHMQKEYLDWIVTFILSLCELPILQIICTVNSTRLFFTS